MTFSMGENRTELLTRASTMLQGGDLAGATALLRNVLELSPDHPDALHLFGLAALKAGKPGPAVRLIERAIAQRPRDSGFHGNCGEAFRLLGDLDRALDHLSQAVELDPGNADAWCNLGSVLRASGQVAKGIAAYRKALAVDPAHANAHFNLGLALLVTGDFAEGWGEYRYRWETVQRSLVRTAGPPIWRGEDLRGRAIHVFHEQGLGDTIQFARYLPLLAGMGADVVFECPVEFHRLLACLGSVKLLPMGAPIQACDYQSPLLSLAATLGTDLETIPARVPYLAPPQDLAEGWKMQLGPSGGVVRVGLCWAGNPQHVNDRNRSCRLTQLSRLATFPDVTFHSLQKGDQGGWSHRAPSSIRLTDWTSELRDFADTAALISNLDLVITDDTAVAHLAGALCVPVWILIPFAPDWRWLLGREDSPWYPSARLFRQSRRGDWRDPIASIAESLGRFRTASRSRPRAQQDPSPGMAPPDVR